MWTVQQRLRRCIRDIPLAVNRRVDLLGALDVQAVLMLLRLALDLSARCTIKTTKTT